MTTTHTTRRAPAPNDAPAATTTRAALARDLRANTITAAITATTTAALLAELHVLVLARFNWTALTAPALLLTTLAATTACAAALAAALLTRLHPVLNALQTPQAPQHHALARHRAARAPLEATIGIIAAGITTATLIHQLKFIAAPGVFEPAPLRTLLRSLEAASVMTLVAFPLTAPIAASTRAYLAATPGPNLPHLPGLTLRARFILTSLAATLLFITAFAGLLTSGQLVRANDLADPEILLVLGASAAIAITLGWAGAHGASRELRALTARLDTLADRDDHHATAEIPPVNAGEIGELERAYNRLNARVTHDLHALAATAAERAREDSINAERARIARELHDGLAKDLVGLALLLEGVAHRQRGRAVMNELLDHAATARHLAAEGRALLRTFREHDLRPLHAQLHDVTLDTTNGPTITVTCPPDLPRLEPAAAHELTQVAREAVRNAATHAHATHVTITVHTDRTELELRVEDDGRGPPAAQPPGHYGIPGMHERLRTLGGHLDVLPRAEGGTTVRATAPLHALTRPPTTPPHAPAGDD